MTRRDDPDRNITEARWTLTEIFAWETLCRLERIEHIVRHLEYQHMTDFGHIQQTLDLINMTVNVAVTRLTELADIVRNATNDQLAVDAIADQINTTAQTLQNAVDQTQ